MSLSPVDGQPSEEKHVNESVPAAAVPKRPKRVRRLWYDDEVWERPPRKDMMQCGSCMKWVIIKKFCVYCGSETDPDGDPDLFKPKRRRVV